MPKIDMKKIVFDKISSTESNVNEGKNIEKKQIVKKTPSKKEGGLFILVRPAGAYSNG